MALNGEVIARWIEKARIPNVGRTDRVIRFFVGIGVFALAAWLGPILGQYSLGIVAFLLGIVGVIILASGIFAFCPLYDKMNMNSLRGKVVHNDQETQAVTTQEQTNEVQ